ncbi:hypothetical protein [Microbacterium oxydans]|uniref:hypothetical protein n=1 Tax=Microbacterium oxydans TaxID=82380 RepID=UPI00366F8418
MTETPLAYTDRVRADRGYLTVSELIADAQNVFLDPYSTLVSAHVRTGTGNVFFPHVRFDAGPDSLLNRPDSTVTVGDRVRLRGKIDVAGASRLGDGCQILGDVSAISVDLGGGGSYRDVDPDLRGAVLKGRGHASRIVLHQGHVINGDGDFAAAAIERQAVYHPVPTRHAIRVAEGRP